MSTAPRSPRGTTATPSGRREACLPVIRRTAASMCSASSCPSPAGAQGLCPSTVPSSLTSNPMYLWSARATTRSTQCRPSCSLRCETSACAAVANTRTLIAASEAGSGRPARCHRPRLGSLPGRAASRVLSHDVVAVAYTHPGPQRGRPPDLGAGLVHVGLDAFLVWCRQRHPGARDEHRSARQSYVAGDRSSDAEHLLHLVGDGGDGAGG